MTAFSKYDFIICGAGCAGLSLSMYMISSKKFDDKKILLVDGNLKKSNDRTWCFWQTKDGLFENLVCRQWDRLWFYGENFSKDLIITPYQYKMIRGIDFYEYCLQVIQQKDNFEILHAKVESEFSDMKTGIVACGKKIFANYVFNSIPFDKGQSGKNDLWLWQHFKGWVIETENDQFDNHSAILMDFRVHQKFGTAFCYVLPFSSRLALIEYTVFSQNIMEEQQYEEELRSYINDILKINSYKIVEKEFGIIPMTNHKFPSRNNNIIHIGSAGGQTKGSTDYTFNFIQKHSNALVKSIIKTGKPFVNEESIRFNFYDSVLLKVLTDGKIPGKEIFTHLFKRNAIDKVFKFLDNESSFPEEIKIISSLPTFPFLKAGIQQLI